MKKINYLLYKIIGVIFIISYLWFVHLSYFETPKYGNNPFYIYCLIYVGVYFICPYILDKIVGTIGILFYAVYTVVQVCYCKMFNQYLYFESALNLFEEASAYTSDAVGLLSPKDILTLLLALVVIVLLCLLKRNKSIKLYLISVLSGACSFILVAYMATNQKEMLINLGNFNFTYNETDRYIYDQITSKKTFVDYFGLESFLYRDIKDHYLVSQKKIDKENEQVNEFLSSNLEYKENEYTGLLSGKHLLLVEGESLNMAAIDEVLTPTLYKLIHEGWFFENFYSPILTGSTSDVDTMVNTSLVAINTGKIASQNYADNTYPTTLAKGFASAGYQVNAFHNNYKIYFNRENYFVSLGYDNFLDATELGLSSNSSDLEVSELISWIAVDENLGFSYWISYSGHSPYIISGLSNEADYPLLVQEEYKEYLELVEQTYPMLCDELKFYLAKNISLDRALEYYIQVYEWMGKSNQLVIALYGDHAVKITDEEIINQADAVLKRSINDTPFVIWYPGIEAQIIEKYCTDIDIMPTLFNLYNIPYDKRTILGNDIFDERYIGMNFDSNWNIKTNDYEYDLASNTFIRLNVDEEIATESLKRFLEYQKISNYIFKNDYFKQ